MKIGENKSRGEELIEFDSLLEFYNFITKMPVNKSFKNFPLHSEFTTSDSVRSSGTASFEEAVELMKNGWQDMSQKLNQRLRIAEDKMDKVMVSKNILGVQGYHPIVSLFLNGIPNNMVTRRVQLVSKKVITIDKAIAYSYRESADRIIDESVKALSIVRKVENQGYRSNLNVVVGIWKGDKTYIVKVRVKSANERLNISKLSFPLVHPSMLRRLFLKFVEVYPSVPKQFTNGYGRPLSPASLRESCSGEIVLPQYIMQDIKRINTLEELENIY